MDTDRFDALTRGLFADPSRRGILHTFLGSVVAFAGGASLATSVADARKRKRKKKKCKGGKKKCGKKCFDLQTDPLHCGSCTLSCAADESCVDGICTCPTGQANCGEGCIDILTDAANCGTCGNACASGACVHGACTCTTDDECPESCSFCQSRVQGGKACIAGFDNPPACESDDDCPVGSICASSFAPVCSTPCAR